MFKCIDAILYLDAQVELEAAKAEFNSAEATFQVWFRAQKVAKEERSSAIQHKVIIILLCMLTFRSSTCPLA